MNEKTPKKEALEMRCKNCIFYKDSSKECHESPPTRIILNILIWKIIDKTVWPKVLDTDACGKFANEIEVCFGGINAETAETIVFTKDIVPNQDKTK